MKLPLIYENYGQDRDAVGKVKLWQFATVKNANNQTCMIIISYSFRRTRDYFLLLQKIPIIFDYFEYAEG